MISFKTKNKYRLDFTSNFKRQLKNSMKQGKDISKLKEVILKLSNGEKLSFKYKNHKLINDKKYKDCYECHIEPDWLLVYQYQNEKLVLLLIAIGSHNTLFK